MVRFYGWNNRVERADLGNGPRFMTRASTNRSRWNRRATLLLLLLVALLLRLLAVGAVQLYTRQQGEIGLFGDTQLYWSLAETIREGLPFEVKQWGVPHRALRTPGYPAFLAACQLLFGEDNSFAIRVVQAVLGTLSVAIVFGLAITIGTRSKQLEPSRTRTIAIVAAAIAAVEPYTIGLSALLLSEALFVPLMLLSLWGLAFLWRPGPLRSSERSDDPTTSTGTASSIVVALLTGFAIGLALLVRSSWGLFIPVALLGWLIFERTKRAVLLAGVVSLTVALTMSFWWIRNAQVFEGRFVPTALWVGASLYDGLGPEADGSSDMTFLDDPSIRKLGEVEQDQYLREEAIRASRARPMQAQWELVLSKVVRYWSPWPNAGELRAPGVTPLSASATLPVFGLLVIGIWCFRHNPSAIILLLGSLFYFFVLHLVFVSSIRYRLPGMVPALIVAAGGMVRLVGGRSGGGDREARKLAVWSVILPITVFVGGAWSAFGHVADGGEVAELLEREAVRLLPDSTLEIGRLQLRPFEGIATLEQSRIRQEIEGFSRPTLEVAWLRVQFDVWELLHGKFMPRKVTVAQPTFRLTRRPDGSWNLQGLLADPWPLPPPDRPPEVQIKAGKLLLVEPDNTIAVLRDLRLQMEPISSNELQFKGTALGDGHQRLELIGTWNMKTGVLLFNESELNRLELGASFADRLPEPWKQTYGEIGLKSGNLDLVVHRLRLDLNDPGSWLDDHSIELWLRSGNWACDRLPFRLSEVEFHGLLTNGLFQIDRASASHGRTIARVRGSVDALNSEEGPLDLQIDVTDLEFEPRLRKKLTPDLEELWARFQPTGRTHAYLHLVRTKPGAPMGVGLTLDLQDVGIRYEDCQYPLEHISGPIHWASNRVEIPQEPGLQTLIGNRPAKCWGTIENPGTEAHVELHFEIGALPIDQTLLNALDPEVRTVLDQFGPTGTVQVVDARLIREPPPVGSTMEQVQLFADLALGAPSDAGGFSFRWIGLPYRVSNVTGRLIIEPTAWEFRDVSGSNGRARIFGNGRVEHRGGDDYKTLLTISARDLPFDDQLKDALPPEWETTWKLLDPRGKASLDAEVDVDGPTENIVLQVRPDPGTSVRLQFTPTSTVPGVDPKPLALPAMEEIGGNFIYDDGLLLMEDVSFSFRDSPVRFPVGSVLLEEGGRFQLGIRNLRVENFRIDAALRRLMSTEMAAIARMLDEGRPIPAMSGDLGVGWSGFVDDPAWVAWSNGLVVLDGQTIRTEIPLEGVQGRFRDFAGLYDGRTVELNGLIDLDSLTIAGQQITKLRAPLVIDRERARLDNIKGNLLGGRLTGNAWMGLDAEPKYAASLAIEQADLTRFTAGIPGKQEFRGLLYGELSLSGAGSDPRSIRGQGRFMIDQGDLGDLPSVLRFVKFLNTRDINASRDDTAFDSAAVSVRIEDGEAILDPIRLTGDAISLQGSGTMDLSGQLDLHLRLLYGRDGLKIPFASDIVQRASAQILDIEVKGPASFPQFNPGVLPGSRRVIQSFGQSLFPRAVASPEVRLRR